MADTSIESTGDKAVAERRQRHTIQSILESERMKLSIAAALPRHMTPDRFIRVALTATMRNPDLLNCTQESFFKCLLDLSSMGLEPNGRDAHLIPRWNRTVTPHALDCTLIVDYKGLNQLVRRSGEVNIIHADVVYSNDEFSYSYGSKAHLDHIPAEGDRGVRRLAYSYVRLKDNSEDFMVLSMNEVELVRKRSASPNKGPWVTDYDEMAKKSAFRRHSKWLPFSSELRRAIEYDDAISGGGDIENVIKMAAERAAAIASKKVDQITASADANRGHDGAMPDGDEDEETPPRGAQGAQEQPKPAPETKDASKPPAAAQSEGFSDEENRRLDREIAEQEAMAGAKQKSDRKSGGAKKGAGATGWE